MSYLRIANTTLAMDLLCDYSQNSTSVCLNPSARLPICLDVKYSSLFSDTTITFYGYYNTNEISRLPARVSNGKDGF